MSDDTISASTEEGRASANSWRSDRRNAAFLIAGLVFLIASLLGAFFQHPRADNIKISRLAWLIQPAETNAFLRLPSTGNELTEIHFNGPRLGWAVGDGGTILHTTDGGQSWQAQRSGTQNSLFSIYETGDGWTLWAVGGSGTILHTTDGGQSWQAQSSSTQDSLFSIHGTSDGRTLWVVGGGGTILHTTDGGQSWQTQRSDTQNSLFSIHGTSDGQILWAVGGGGTILHTTDGGQSWRTQRSGTQNSLFSIHGTSDGQILWAVGDSGTILHTTDGGQSWQTQRSDTQNSLFSIHGTSDGRILWAVGGGGTILHTTDGGQSWQTQRSGTLSFLYSIDATGDGRTLWAVGDSGTILHTTDGGQSWQAQSSGTQNFLTSIYGTGEGRTLWAAGDGGTILHTTDGGQSWQAQSSGTQNFIESIDGSGDSQTLWAVGGSGTILHTTDGGQSWQTQSSGTQSSLFSIHGTSDGRTLWAVGGGGMILHTTDSGQSWQAQSSGTQNTLYSIDGTGDGRTLWAVGDGGRILHTTDGGQSWQAQSSNTQNFLLSINGTGDGRTLWAVGSGGTILHTTDGGQSWQAQSSGTQNSLYSIHGTGDGRTLWAVGEGGTILHTTDGGQSWQAQSSGTQNFLTSLYGAGEGRSLWAVGGGGTILQTTDSGKSWRSLRKANPYRYRPARWVWFGLIVSVCLTATASIQLQRPLPAAKQSIENAGLSDQAATRVEQDLLDVTETIQGLVEFLRNRNTEPPVTLSVEGAWGIGKTSMMRMLETELSRAGVPTVWFNAWHNEGEEQMLAFLLESIRQEAFPKWWNICAIPFRLRLLFIRFERWPIILLLLSAVVLFVVHPALDWLRHVETDDVKNFGNLIERLRDVNWTHFIAIGTALAAAYPLVRKVLMLATGISAKPSDLLSPSDSKSGNAARTSFRPRFAREFREAIEAFGPDRRITIFIDDLDRCQPEQVRQTLEAVNFLVSSGGCFVVMGIARNVVEASVGLGFKEIAEELDDQAESISSALAIPEDKDQAAKNRRRAFARNYLLKLINLTVMLRPYSGDSLARVATSAVKNTEQPSFFKQAIPYGLFGTTVLATVFLWNVHKIPQVDPKKKVLQEEVYQLPGGLEAKQLKSLLVERDAEGKVVGDKRTYDVDKTKSQLIAPPSAVPPAEPPPRPDRNDERPAPSQVAGFEPGQTYSTSHWLWWMLPLVVSGAGIAARALFFRRQRSIQDSPKFRDALLLWRAVYENEIRTPREIKRFVNELRYQAIRFRGPQPFVPVGKTTPETPDRISDKEPTLILLAILEKLTEINPSGNPADDLTLLPEEYRATLAEHLQQFGRPSDGDYRRYRDLFGQNQL